MATVAHDLTQMSTEASTRQASTLHAPRRFYAPELDVLRFLAFVLVFGRHVSNALGTVKRQGGTVAAAAVPVAGAAQAAAASLSPAWRTIQGALQSLDFGVCLFFFLSSFLITRLLLIEKASTGKVAVRDFYIRRSLRIWPLYFTFLALVAVASHFLPFLEVTRYRMLAAIFFVSNWAAVLHGWACISIQPLWSVSVEEQFYLLWPNFARFGRTAIIAASTVLAAASMGTLFYLGHRPGTEVTATWPNTLVQCLFLAGGALTACLSTPESRRLKTSLRLALVVCGFAGWVVASTSLHVVRTQSPGALALMAGYLLMLLGTFLIFTGVVGWNATPIPASLRYLGKISYGLYVFHSSCLMISERIIAHALAGLHLAHLSPYAAEGISALLALSLTLAFAAASYRFLEAPFLRLKERFTVVPSRAA